MDKGIYPTYKDEDGVVWEFNYIVGFHSDEWDRMLYRVKGTSAWQSTPRWVQEGGVPKEISEHFHGPMIEDGRAISDADALDDIARLFDQTDWDADCVNTVVDVVRKTGRVIRDIY